MSAQTRKAFPSVAHSVCYPEYKSLARRCCRRMLQRVRQERFHWNTNLRYNFILPKKIIFRLCQRNIYRAEQFSSHRVCALKTLLFCLFSLKRLKEIGVAFMSGKMNGEVMKPEYYIMRSLFADASESSVGGLAMPSSAFSWRFSSPVRFSLKNNLHIKYCWPSKLLSTYLSDLSKTRNSPLIFSLDINFFHLFIDNCF